MKIHQYHKSLITFYGQSSSIEKISNFIDFYLSFESECDLLERKKNTAKILKEKLNSQKKIKKQNEQKKQKKYIKKFLECPICKNLFQLKHVGQKYCSPQCSSKAQQKVERPSREELKQLIRSSSFLSIARLYNVSDNAIRKWCKAYSLPYSSSIIKKYNDSEWELI